MEDTHEAEILGDSCRRYRLPEGLLKHRVFEAAETARKTVAFLAVLCVHRIQKTILGDASPEILKAQLLKTS